MNSSKSVKEFSSLILQVSFKAARFACKHKKPDMLVFKTEGGRDCRY